MKKFLGILLTFVLIFSLGANSVAAAVEEGIGTDDSNSDVTEPVTEDIADPGSEPAEPAEEAAEPADEEAVVSEDIAMIFYDSEGTLIKSIPGVVSGSNTRIDANGLASVPDFITVDGVETVVLSWKLKGSTGTHPVDDRYNIPQYYGAGNMTASVELEPLLTMPKADMFDILAIDGHMDTTQGVINDGESHWAAYRNNDLGVVPANPRASTNYYDFSDYYQETYVSKFIGSNNTGAASRIAAEVEPRNYQTLSLWPWMKEGGQSGSLFTAFTGSYGVQDTGRGVNDLANSKTLAMIWALHWSQSNNEGDVALVTTPEEFYQAKDDDKLAAMQFVEAGIGLTPENYYELLEQYYDLGIRGMSFAYSANNIAYQSTWLASGRSNNTWINPRAANNTVSPVARQAYNTGVTWGGNWGRVTTEEGGTGAGTEPVTDRAISTSDAYDPFPAGLTDAGKDALARMDELGIFADGIHQHANTVRDYLEYSDNPILETHADTSDVTATFVDKDGVTKSKFLEVARSGGVYCFMITGNNNISYNTANTLETAVKYLQDNGEPGEFDGEKAWDHVAIGTDADGGGLRSGDISDSRYFYRYAREMFARQYPAERVEKVLSGNILRAIGTVQANAEDSEALARREGSAAVISAPMVDSKPLGLTKNEESVHNLGYKLASGTDVREEVVSAPAPDKRDPILKATVTGAVSGRVIVDGMEVDPALVTLSGNTLTADLTGKPLQEKYHVVTFEATDTDGKVARNTTIFYTGHLPEVHRTEIVDRNDNSLKDIYVADNSTSIQVDDWSKVGNANGRLKAADFPTASASGRAIVDYRHWWTGEKYVPGEASFNKLTNYDVKRSIRLIATDELSALLYDKDPSAAVIAKAGGTVYVTIDDPGLNDGEPVDFRILPINIDENEITVTLDVVQVGNRFMAVLPASIVSQLEDDDEYGLIYKGEVSASEGHSDYGQITEIDKAEFSELMAKLNTLIAQADKIDGTLYSAASWAVLETALDAAKGVAGSSLSLPAEVSKAITDLLAAIDGLTLLEPYSYITITPTHTALELGVTGKDEATLKLVSEPENLTGESDAVWSSDSAAVTVTPSSDKKSAVVKAVSKGFANITVTSGEYTAAATVEVFDGAVTKDGYKVDLLTNAATVNKAKEDGVLVPFGIVENGADYSGGATAAADNSSLIIESAKLTGSDGDKFDVKPVSDRYVEITAKESTAAKTYRNLGLELTLKGSGDKIETTSKPLAVTVQAVWPKITLKADQLNLFYKTATGTGTVTGVASDGSDVTITGIAKNKDTALNFVELVQPASYTAKAKGTASLKVTVDLKGYVTPYKPTAKFDGKTAAVNAKVVNTAPGLKLSATTVTLSSDSAYGLPYDIKLLPKSSKDTLDSFGTIQSVTVGENPANLYNGSGVIRLPADTAAGKNQKVLVTFNGGGEVSLKLTVKTGDPTKAKFTTKATKLSVNKDHNGDFAVLAVNTDIQNLKMTLDTKEALPAGITVTKANNQVTFKADGSVVPNPANGKGTYTINIVSTEAGVPITKPVAVTLSVITKTPSFTVSQKGKIDILNAASAITGTVKLSNTVSDLDTVTLTGADAGKFIVSSITPKTFDIQQNPDALVVPGVKCSLGVKVRLKNGIDMELAKPIAITPVQSATKAIQSTTAVTLYKSAPKDGAEVTISIPSGAKIGIVRLNGASVAANNFFQLVKSGDNTWTLKFRDDFSPATSMKASYNVAIEVWVDGTYVTAGEGGDPMPLGYTDAKGKFTAKSSPIMMTVKVNVK